MISAFVLFFLIQSGAVALAYSRGAIYADDLQKLLLQLLSIYAVPLGVIIGGVFGHRKREIDRHAALPFWVAFAMAIVWNVLLTLRTLAFAFADEDSVVTLLDFLRTVSAASLFLVGGSLAYFFAKS